jgi:Aldo/keto reductases, related to diketogulonate reductase
MTRKAALGITLPRLGQGTWYLGDSPDRRKDEIHALRTGIDMGMTVIDTAEMYGKGRSEGLVGEALKGRRDQVYLISKVLPSNADREGIARSCESSLARLQTDVLDMYMLHWMGDHPLEETVEGMQRLVEQGKIRSWGVSNLDVDEMERLFAVPDGDTCAANQILYNLSRRGVEFDLLPWCRERSVRVVAYSPLEQGRILSNRTLELVAERHDATPAQIALAWLLHQPGIMAIPKSGSLSHVRANAASADIRLSEDDIVMLENTYPAPTRKKPLEVL